MQAETVFLKFSSEKLEQLCGRIESCVAKLSEEQVWTRGAENENAVGNLLLHLAGNVRQWILHGVGGQPDHRQRDAEFDARGRISKEQMQISKEQMMDRLRSTVEEAAELIRSLPPERLMERRTIQTHYDVTSIEAIYHVVEHFSGHTGQIIFATKLLTGSDLGFYAYLRGKKAQEQQP